MRVDGWTAAWQTISQTFRALRNPNYRLYWFGQGVSLTGHWAHMTAQAWLVLQLTDSPLALGLVTTIQFAPLLVLVLFAGVAADRLPKRPVLIGIQVLMLIETLTLALLTWSGLVQLWHVYVLAGLFGVLAALENPFRQAFVFELVGPEDLPNAVTLNSTQFNLAQTVGPAVGGVVISIAGVAGCFFFNAASFLGVLGGLLLMRPERFFLPARPSRGRVLTQIGEGFRYVLTTPDTLLVVLMLAVIGVFGLNFTVLLPLIARYVLAADPVGFGGLTSLLAVGSVVAGLVMAGRGQPSRRTLLVGAGGVSLLLFALALVDSWLAIVPLLFALGVASMIFTTAARIRMQLAAPSHLRGRVMSIFALLFLGSLPIGAVIVGTLAEQQNVRIATAELAAVCALGTLGGVVFVRRVAAEVVSQPAPAGRLPSA